MFTPLKHLLPRAAHRYDMHRQLTAAHVCEKYRRIAPTIVSDEMALHTAPRFYKDKILIISVANATVAQEIFLHKSALIEALNAALGQPTVTDIRTCVTSANS